METLNPEKRKRVLPSWMTGPVDEKRVMPVKTPKKRRMVAVPMGAATRCAKPWSGHAGRPDGEGGFSTACLGFQSGRAVRAPSVKTVYCMNEAEMVDVALGILVEGHKQEKPRQQPFLAEADKLQLSPSSSESPHTSSPRSSSEEEDSGGNSPALGLSPSQGPGASKSACSRNPEEGKEEEEDALKYVREIFFS